MWLVRPLKALRDGPNLGYSLVIEWSSKVFNSTLIKLGKPMPWEGRGNMIQVPYPLPPAIAHNLIVASQD